MKRKLPSTFDLFLYSNRRIDFESHSATDLLLKTSYEVIIFLNCFFRIKLTYHLEKRVIYDMASRSTERACKARLAGILVKIGVFFVSKMFLRSIK